MGKMAPRRGSMKFSDSLVQTLAKRAIGSRLVGAMGRTNRQFGLGRPAPMSQKTPHRSVTDALMKLQDRLKRSGIGQIGLPSGTVLLWSFMHFSLNVVLMFHLLTVSYSDPFYFRQGLIMVPIWRGSVRRQFPC